jgi:hypothetical protein
MAGIMIEYTEIEGERQEDRGKTMLMILMNFPSLSRRFE